MSLAGLSLRDLEYLVAVAKCRHFGRAAAACAVSQPSLSAQIRKLERFLGVTVFERTPRKVAVTSKGEAILARAEVILDEARALLDAARDGRSALAGRFRLGSIPTLGPYLIPFALRPLREAFPEIDLVLSEGQTEELMVALRHGEIDAVLACAPDDGESLVVHPLFVEPFFLVHRPGHAPSWPAAEDPVVLLDEGHCLRDQALSACGPGICLAARYASGIEMLRFMVAAGEGISLVPALAAQSIGDLDGRVAYTPLDGDEIGRDVVLIARASDPRAEHMPALARIIRDAQASGCLLCRQGPHPAVPS